MPFRICRSFTVESGHLLSKHPESCRFPHGHTRRIEVVVAADSLDQNDMVLDFKALKLALKDFIDRLDHSMAINRADPLLPAIRAMGNDAVVEFDSDPTTERMAQMVYEFVASVLRDGWSDGTYEIPAGRARLERVRVGETPNSWAEYSDH